MTTKHAVLHAHSEYSVRDSLIRVAELPELAAKNGWDACAITDHGAIEGVPAFLKSCQKVGIKPIVGCEIYVGCPDTYHWTGKYSRKDKLNHLTILTKNAKGFSSLMKLISLGHRDYYDHRRQKAAIPLDLVLEHLTDCVVLSGCFSSPFWRGTEQAASDLVRFVDRFKDDFYFEVQPLHDWGEQVELNKMIRGMAEEFGVQTVVTPDCHFGHAHEHVFHDALLAVADRKSIHDPNVWRFSTRRSFMGTPEESFEHLAHAGFPTIEAKRSVEATGEIAEKISPWTWDDLPAPRFPDVGGDMRPLVEKGFEAKGLKGRHEYEERLAKEMKTFKEAGLDRYLLLVRHCIELFRKNGGEIGPRGSVGGSLVAYCLGLSALDPLIHNLSWERFYAPGRKGWPDVDIDLDEETREKAPEILRKEFGEDKVAQISNYAEFGLRMAIRDAAKAYGIEIDDDSKFDVSEKEFEDIEDIPPGKELARKSADAAAFARMLVGRVRQYGAHAGGFVISQDSLMGGRSAIVHRGKDTALPWDMKVAEELGFIKLDFLGLDTLSAIKSINSSINVDWDKVPLDDVDTIRDFQEGLTAGVPQFLTTGLRNFIRKLKPKKFEDLVWATSAFRPGALGQLTPDELATAYNRDPGEILVYQEDVMKICVECAGFSWTEATKVQKTMAKSQGIEAMGEWTDKFVEGCVKTIDADPGAAAEYWLRLLNFGRYAFNKSHAAAYSWNSYRIAWAKRKYPLETFIALLKNEENRQPIIDEAPKFGVTILPPDPNRSTLEWQIVDGKILMPLTVADGMDLSLAKIILEKREDGGPFKDAGDFVNRMVRKAAKKGGNPIPYKYPESLPDFLFSGRMPGQNFTREIINPKGVWTKSDLDEIVKKEASCMKCPFSNPDICKGGVVPIEFGQTNIMVVGEAPGREETKKHRPFVGPSGRMLDEKFVKYGVNSKRLTWTNVSHCLPPFIAPGQTEPMTRSVADAYAAACPWLDEEIAMLKPPLILAVGKKAWAKLVSPRESITKVNATVREVNGVKIVGCLHPAFVMRDMNRMPDFEAAIEKFAELYKILYPDDIPEHRLPKDMDMSVRARAILGRR